MQSNNLRLATHRRIFIPCLRPCSIAQVSCSKAIFRLPAAFEFPSSACMASYGTPTHFYFIVRPRNAELSNEQLTVEEISRKNASRTKDAVCALRIQNQHFLSLATLIKLIMYTDKPKTWFPIRLCVASAYIRRILIGIYF